MTEWVQKQVTLGWISGLVLLAGGAQAQLSADIEAVYRKAFPESRRVVESWRPKPWTTRMPLSDSWSVARTSATRSRTRR